MKNCYDGSNRHTRHISFGEQKRKKKKRFCSAVIQPSWRCIHPRSKRRGRGRSAIAEKKEWKRKTPSQRMKMILICDRRHGHTPQTRVFRLAALKCVYLLSCSSSSSSSSFLLFSPHYMHIVLKSKHSDRGQWTHKEIVRLSIESVVYQIAVWWCHQPHHRNYVPANGWREARGRHICT